MEDLNSNTLNIIQSYLFNRYLQGVNKVSLHAYLHKIAI